MEVATIKPVCRIHFEWVATKGADMNHVVEHGRTFLDALAQMSYAPDDVTPIDARVALEKGDEIQMTVHLRKFKAVQERVLVQRMNRVKQTPAGSEQKMPVQEEPFGAPVLTKSIGFYEVLRDGTLAAEPIERVLYDSQGNFRFVDGAQYTASDMVTKLANRLEATVRASLVTLREKNY
jgi:hypothetical protein